MKEPAAGMEKIPSTMVLHKHVYGVDTRFSTMAGPLVNNHLVKRLGAIRRGTYQVAAEDSRWAYKPVSYLWPDVDLDSNTSDDGSTYEGDKYHENPDNQEK